VLQGRREDVLLLDVTPLSAGHRDAGAVCSRGSSTVIRRSRPRRARCSPRRRQPDRRDDRVFQGEREMAADNKMLGQFDLIGIPPSRAGVPQIEVTFDIDANGIVNVQAKEKALARSSRSASRLRAVSDETDIQKMVKDAEPTAEDDKKRKAQVEAKNHAELWSIRPRRHWPNTAPRSARRPPRDRERHGRPQGSLEGRRCGGDYGQSNALAQASMKLGEAMYKQASEQPPGGGPDGSGAEGKQDDVVDAEFTEVDDDKKNKKSA